MLGTIRIDTSQIGPPAEPCPQCGLAAYRLVVAECCNSPARLLAKVCHACGHKSSGVQR
jgi:hypothetical protein